MPSDPLYGAYPIGHTCPERASLPMGTHHIKLLSGYHRDVELPSIAQWIRYGGLPNDHLMAVAIKKEWPDFKPHELEEDDRAAYDDLIDFTVSQMCRPDTLPLEYVRGYVDGQPISPRLPKEDRDTLWAVANREAMFGEAEEVYTKIQMALMEPFRGVALGGELAGNGKSKGRGSRPRARTRG